MRFFIFNFIAVLLITSLSGCVVFVPFLPEKSSEPEQCLASLGGDSRPLIASKQTARSKRRPKASREQRKIKSLIRNLRHEDTVVRIRAASSLGYIGRPAKKTAVRPLIVSLRDNHKWVRRSAAKALGRLNARTAVPSLIQTLRDSDPWVAHSAANALRKIGTRDALSAVRSYKN